MPTYWQTLLVAVTIASALATPGTAQTAPQSAYDQLCGRQGKASATTCTALRKELDAATATENAPAGPSQAGSNIAATPSTALAVPGYLGVRLAAGPLAQTSIIGEIIPGSPAAASGLRVDDVITSIGTPEKPLLGGMGGYAAVMAFLSTRTAGDQVTVGYLRNGAPTYERLTLSEKPGVAPVARPGANVKGVRFLPLGVNVGGAFEPTDRKHGSVGDKYDCYEIQARPGQHLRLTTFNGFYAQTHVKRGKCDYYADGVAWSHTAPGQDGFAFNFTAPNRGALAVWIAGNPTYSPDYVLRLDELTPAEYAAWQGAIQVKQAAAEQAKAQRAAERSDFLGMLMQGAVAAGQGYIAGMEEANQANARSQAIIDAAAESDRQYRAAQRAAELAQRAASQVQTSKPFQSAQASLDQGARIPPSNPTQLQPQASSPAAAAGGGSPPLASRPPVASGSGRMEPLRVYFQVPLVIHSGDTRNTLCYSNVVTAGSVDFSTGDNSQALALIAPYRQRFLNKCRLHRETDGTAIHEYQSLRNGGSRRTYDSRDIEVLLP